METVNYSFVKRIGSRRLTGEFTRSLADTIDVKHRINKGNVIMTNLHELPPC